LRPPAALSGWKDTVYVAPSTRMRLVLRLPDSPDPSWPYMYHCHMLRHEDAGMMGQFLVVAPAPHPHHTQTHRRCLTCLTWRPAGQAL
jgi:hypothetical protein